MAIDPVWMSGMTWLPWLLLPAAGSGVLLWLWGRTRIREERKAAIDDRRRFNQPVSGDEPPERPSRSMPFWWLLLILLLVWDAMPNFIHSNEPPVAKIPYSTFISEVQSDNVSQVGIQGSEIAGKLKQARDWHTGTGELTKVPAKQAPSAAGKGADTSGKEAKTTPAPSAAGKGADTSGKKAKTTPAPSTSHPLAATAMAHKPDKADARVVKVVDFETVFPSSVGDPQLLPLLESHGVEVVAQPRAPHWIGLLVGSLLPTLLLVGFFWWMGRRAMGQQQSIFGAGKSQVRRYHREEVPPVTFADVAGIDAAKGQLQEVVSILKSPERYQALGARTPRGVLLAGPPGTGKTLLARAVAGEAHVPFFSISGSEFVEMFVGVGASRVRNMFQEVKAASPAILFLDELDAVGRRRGTGLGMVNDEREQTLNQLLVEMDGFDERQSVIVIAATNRPDVLDPALRRPGRFDREVVVGLPDLKGRRGILEIHTRRLSLADDVELDALASMTMGMNGAQLANLCNEAALVAAREGHPLIQRLDFEKALDRIVLGDPSPLALDDAARRVVAYHESGHALVAWLTPEADPVHKITIVPHGMALGVTEQRPTEDRYNLSRRYLTARLHVMLGGRSAEETAIGEITTGAENDLIEATRQARRMVTVWGMSELGIAAYESSGEDRFLGYELTQNRSYSEETARRIDAEVNRLLDESHQAVRALLASARDRLDRLAETLLEKETIEYTELEDLLGPRPSIQTT